MKTAFFPRFVLVLSFIGLVASPAYARSGPTGFADLAEKLLPSVVNISTTQTIKASDDGADMPDLPDLQLPPGSPFEEFFKDFLDKQKNAPQAKRKATALGSGFVVDPSGYIVTNNHVIQDADAITVILQDDTNLSAKVVGRDKKTDLALLKVEPKTPLPAVAWGDSDKARVGDWIMAIGDPYGLGGTVTAGILSARARNINSGPYDDYLQTDAPINRGNSGGPMFNMDGEVIGINTAIFSPSGGSIGIGFAIPSNIAHNVIDQLRAHGHITRGWLGVHIQTVTPEIADGLGLGTSKGALVSSVEPKGPAAKAGIEDGDVIVSFDGKEVSEMRRLPLMVAGTDIDKTVDVTVFRKGKEVTLKVKVGELPTKDDDVNAKDGGGSKAKEPTVKAEKVGELGLSVAPLTPALRTKYDIKKDVKGLLVTAASPDGLAADQGIMEGDVIVEAAQENVTSAKDFHELVRQTQKKDKALLLLVNHGDDMRYVAVSFKKK